MPLLSVVNRQRAKSKSPLENAALGMDLATSLGGLASTASDLYKMAGDTNMDLKKPSDLVKKPSSPATDYSKKRLGINS